MSVDLKPSVNLLNERRILSGVYFFTLYIYTYYFFACRFYTYKFSSLLKSTSCLTRRARDRMRGAASHMRGARQLGGMGMSCSIGRGCVALDS
jgi:hypothetical protein